jgi:hypothetical protein
MKRIETLEQREQALKYMREYAEETEHPLFTPDSKKQRIYDLCAAAVQEHNDKIFQPLEEHKDDPVNDPPEEEPESKGGWFD